MLNVKPMDWSKLEHVCYGDNTGVFLIRCTCIETEGNYITGSDSSQMFDYSYKILFFYVGSGPIKIWPVKSYELEKKL